MKHKELLEKWMIENKGESLAEYAYKLGYGNAVDNLKFLKNELDPVSEGVLMYSIDVVVDYLEKVKE